MFNVHQIKICSPHFQLLNLHGKTLVCYVISFLAAYTTLAIVQFNNESRMRLCYEVGMFQLYINICCPIFSKQVIAFFGLLDNYYYFQHFSCYFALWLHSVGKQLCALIFGLHLGKYSTLNINMLINKLLRKKL